MAQRLKKRGIVPDIILSSDAERAKATALITAENLHFPKTEIKLRPTLYHASAQNILTEIRQAGDPYDVLFLFGHNPGLTDLINFFGGNLDNLPTCGQFGFTFDTDRWTDIHSRDAAVWFYDYPKNKSAI